MTEIPTEMHFPKELWDKYEFHQWKHACAILKSDFQNEWIDLIAMLENFRLLKSWINKRNHFAGGVLTPPLTKGAAPLESPECGSPPQVAGFIDKSNLIWHKVRKDGEPDGRGVGFYFRNTTEIILFGIRGHMRTLDPGRSQVNIIRTMKQEHSRKPDALYDIIEKCSPGPYLELFARGTRKKWVAWGNQANNYDITWNTYSNNSNGKKMDGNIIPLPQFEGIQTSLCVEEKAKKIPNGRLKIKI